MKVSEVINFAVYGDLKPLGLAEIDPSNPERVSNIASIISYINLGTIELYKRFGLSKKSLTFSGVSDGDVWDMPDDFLYLNYATSEDENNEVVTVNDDTSRLNVTTPSPFTIVLKVDKEDYPEVTDITVHFLAGPSIVTKETDNVLLPYQFLEALLHYVAYKGHGALTPNTKRGNNTYYQRFEASCVTIQEEGLYTMDNQGNDKLTQKFFI